MVAAVHDAEECVNGRVTASVVQSRNVGRFEEHSRRLQYLRRLHTTIQYH